MKNTWLLLALMILFGNTIYSQDYSIEWSEPQDMPSKARFNGFTHNDDNYTLYFRDGNTYVSKVHDKELNSVQEAEADAPYDKKLAEGRIVQILPTKSGDFGHYAEKSKNGRT